MCERSSKFLPGPLSHSPIKVDDFSRGAVAYFLTHAHTDHLKGLRDNWREGRLFCTEITKKLLMLKFPGLDERLIRTVSVGETRLITLNDHFSVCLTVLDARHCAGSCMYMFESKHFGRVLHTGDFRYELDQQIPKALLEVEEGVKTSVYLDNTYGLKSSPRTPSRKEVRDALVCLLALYPQSARFVFCMHGLGKEELLVEVAKVFGSKVIVDEERLEQINAFGEASWDGIFTSDVTAPARLVCVRRGHGRLGEETLEEQDQPENPMDEEGNDIGTLPFRKALKIGGENDVFITPSGWCGMGAYEFLKHFLDRSASSSVSQLPRSLKVPYSLHASYEELVRFVRDCDFQYVIPIVNITAAHRDELEIETITRKWTQLSPWKPAISPQGFELDGGRRRERSFPETRQRNRVMASPESHKRRLEAKKMRFAKSPTTSSLGEDIEVVFRREGNVTDRWTKDEDDILRSMQHKRQLWDCIGHELERRKLRRSDHEIFVRLLTLQQQGEGISSITSTLGCHC